MFYKKKMHKHLPLHNTQCAHSTKPANGQEPKQHCQDRLKGQNRHRRQQEDRHEKRDRRAGDVKTNSQNARLTTTNRVSTTYGTDGHTVQNRPL